MNTINSTHLSDEQFADYALGMAPGGAAAHLSQCSACTDELARFGALVNAFGAATLGWSESRTPFSLRQQALKVSVRPRFAVASWALAVGLVFSVGLSTMMHREHRGIGDESSATVASNGHASDCSDTEIAQDNKMLRDVNMEIGGSDPSPFRQYGLRETETVRSESQMGSGSQ
jgi:hypothetical protein